jgi:hypothetical protein
MKKCNILRVTTACLAALICTAAYSSRAGSLEDAETRLHTILSGSYLTGWTDRALVPGDLHYERLRVKNNGDLKEFVLQLPPTYPKGSDIIVFFTTTFDHNSMPLQYLSISEQTWPERWLGGCATTESLGNSVKLRETESVDTVKLQVRINGDIFRPADYDQDGYLLLYILRK